MEDSRATIEQLLRMDIEGVWVLLGQDIQGIAATPARKGQVVAAARSWLQRRRKAFSDTLCCNESIRKLAGAPEQKRDRVLLVSAVADLIASLAIGVSPITVAVLLVREGIFSLCEEYWGDIRSAGE